jgi:intein-encoded DNA endonuclease-like protein
MPLDLKREFIRAFFDDEGCMDFRPKNNVRKVRGYQKNMQILRIIKALLADLDITARIVFPNEVVIVGKENLIRFEREINFSPGVYMNGARSNSRWKKHIEKRELLRRAIESFKS